MSAMSAVILATAFIFIDELPEWRTNRRERRLLIKQCYLSGSAYGASNVLSDLIFENSSLYYGNFTRMDGIRWLSTDNVIGPKILKKYENRTNTEPLGLASDERHPSTCVCFRPK